MLFIFISIKALSADTIAEYSVNIYALLYFGIILFFIFGKFPVDASTNIFHFIVLLFFIEFHLIFSRYLFSHFYQIIIFIKTVSFIKYNFLFYFIIIYLYLNMIYYNLNLIIQIYYIIKLFFE